ncbi:30S ribosomal protein S16 [Planctomycetes bacterium Poly30]|uniref:Small ribosomal subunit protein bS16 n=1 Tax=Saltatorellus ferox TaxID=2528018 RepID=A0A518ESE5_9BACT|nr:30S ribosomal protein S16 [Planctomycetes bacterium Poly30]
MAVVIRMKRTGRRNRPCYRISVADSRFPRDGRSLETLGLYDPIAGDKEKQITLKVDRAQHWLSVGAVPSPTVRSIFKRHDVYTGDFEPKPKAKRDRSGRKKTTATGTRRAADKNVRTERKSARQAERIAAKRAAAKAAAAGAE